MYRWADKVSGVFYIEILGRVKARVNQVRLGITRNYKFYHDMHPATLARTT